MKHHTNPKQNEADLAKGEVFEGVIRIKLRDKGYVSLDGV